jgi:hypothetical protein
MLSRKQLVDIQNCIKIDCKDCSFILRCGMDEKNRVDSIAKTALELWDALEKARETLCYLKDMTIDVDCTCETAIEAIDKLIGDETDAAAKDI